MVLKKDFVKAVASDAKLTEAQAGAAVNAVFANIEKILVDGESVQFNGFGSFKTSERKARTGRNPSTGATVEIPAARVPAFHASKKLKDNVK